MEMETLPLPATQIVLVALLVLASVLVEIWVLRTFLLLCPPNEVLVLSGSAGGPRLVFGGRVLRKPFIERVDQMRLTAHPVRVSVAGAYSRGNVPVNIEAFGLVGVSDDPAVTPNAVERFLGRSDDEIIRVAKETLEGALRGVVATLSPEELIIDRLEVAASLNNEVEDDMRKLGLSLILFKLMRVTDDTGHVVALTEAARKAHDQAHGGAA